MEIRKIRAATMRDALFCVRRELGDDAVIHSTRSEHHKGLFGIAGRAYVEITASRGVPEPAQKIPPPVVYAPPLNVAREKVAATVAAVSGPEQLHKIQDELTWIRGALEQFQFERGSGALPEELREIYSYLLQQEVSEDIARALIKQLRAQLTGEALHDRAVVRAQLAAVVRKTCVGCEPIRLVGDGPTVVAFVGPTGVGKTTTIAKLAADFSLAQHKRVAVVTIDTYRIAAVEQLRTYMDIMEIPLAVVSRPEQMRPALAGFRDYDIILMDTAGRSQRDREQLSSLREFLAAAQPHEIHLVLSSTVNYNNTLDIIAEFSVVGAQKVLFTKLDEAVNFGLLLSVLAKVNKGLSYMTTGQSVPDDLTPASYEALTQLVLGGYADAGSGG